MLSNLAGRLHKPRPRLIRITPFERVEVLPNCSIKYNRVLSVNLLLLYAGVLLQHIAGKLSWVPLTTGARL